MNQALHRRTSSVAGAVVGALAVAGAYAATALSGTRSGIALALTATVGPVLLYVALFAPVTFPFGLYAFLVPMSSIINIASFGTLTRLLGAVSAVALLFFMLRTKRFSEPHRGLAVWILLYLWMGASVFWAIDPTTALQQLPTALQLFGLYIVISMLRIDLRTLQQVVAFVVAGGAIAGCYLLYLHGHGGANFQGRLWLRNDSVDLNPDFFSAALVLPAGLALSGGLWARGFGAKIVWMGAFAVILVTMMLTGARGPELGLAAMILYLLIRDRHRWQVAIVSGVLLALGAAVAGADFAARWARATAGGGAGRTDIWRIGLLAFKEHWLFGAGYANFPFAYDHAFIHVFEPFYTNWHRVSHNILLGYGVDLGIVGLLLLLAGWVTEFRLLRRIDASDPRYPLRLSLESVLIALFVTGIFADIMTQKFLWLAFMLVVLTRNASAASASVPLSTETAAYHA